MNAIIFHQNAKVFKNTYFPKLYDGLPCDVGNMDEEQENTKQGQAKDDEVLEPYEENKDSLRKSNDPIMMHKSLDPYRLLIPLSYHRKDTKQDKSFPHNFNLHSKDNINLSLLDFIRDIPSYPKFFKILI